MTTQPPRRRRYDGPDVVDFGDRETIPAELIVETRLPCPDVTELFGEQGRREYLEAVQRQGGGA